MSTPTFTDWQCEQAPPANLTSLCLVTECVNNGQGPECAGAIHQCTQGSTNYQNYFSHQTLACQDECSRSCTNCANTLIETQDCSLESLAGQIEGSGTQYSLVYKSSTFPLDYQTGWNVDHSYTQFYIDLTTPTETAALQYFVVAASASAVATGSSSSVPHSTSPSPGSQSTTTHAGASTTVSTATTTRTGAAPTESSKSSGAAGFKSRSPSAGKVLVTTYIIMSMLAALL